MDFLLRCEFLPQPHNGRVAKLILQLVIVVAPASYVTILLPVILDMSGFHFNRRDASTCDGEVQSRGHSLTHTHPLALVYNWQSHWSGHSLT